MPVKPMIREIKAADITQAAQLMEDMWRQHGEEASLIDPAKITSITGADYINSLIKNEKATVLVAAIGENVVGVMSCTTQSLPAFYQNNQEWYLDDLCVAASLRGQGIAGFLVEAAEKLAATRGIHVLTGKIWSFNAASRSVFKKRHFNPDYTYWHKRV